MATAPISNTRPSTACTVCCQLSVTSFDPCGSSGSDMSLRHCPLLQRRRGKRTSAERRGVFILPCPGELFHGTEDDVQGISKVQMAARRGLPNGSRLRLCDAQPLRHLVVKKAFPRHIGLHPFAIDHELGNSTLASALDDLFQSARRALHVNLFIGDIVLGQKALGLAAIGTPGGRVDDQFHRTRELTRKLLPLLNLNPTRVPAVAK